MKILELNTYCGSGSTGKIALNIAKEAALEGDQTVIGYGTGNVPTAAEPFALRIGSRSERKLHGAMRKLFDAEGYGSSVATGRLIDFMREYQPDVVHLHNLHGCYLNLFRLFEYLRLLDVPVLWTLHDCWAFTGHCAYFDYAACDRWQNECHDCPQQRSYPICVGLDGSRRNFKRKRALFADMPNLTLVAPCEWMKETVASSFLAATPTRVIYNGVDRAVFKPTPSELRSPFRQKYMALAVASEWEERKGLRYLIEAAERLKGVCDFVAIGLTQSQTEALPSFMHGLTRTSSQTELAQWYSAADCFVNPTLEDNMPLVNLEALACGTPVAAFRTGGCPECVDDSCGIVVEQKDSAALAQAVQTLCEQRRDRQSACLQRAAVFDSQVCSRAYLSLYHEVCR